MTSHSAILARWTVDPDTWNEYVRESRRRETAGGASARNGFEQIKPGPRLTTETLPGDSSASREAGGVEVTVREDRVSVGKLSFPLGGHDAQRVRIEGSYLEFAIEDFREAWVVPFPLSARLEAVRVAEHFAHRAEEAALVPGPRAETPEVRARRVPRWLLGLLLLILVLALASLTAWRQTGR